MTDYPERIYFNPEITIKLPDGPWLSEPDKIQWVDEATDYDCLMVRNPLGVWCGYVGVGPDHPCYQASYDDIRISMDRLGLKGLLDAQVHGGLTFSDSCQPSSDEFKGVCHVPYPGRTHDIWWFGFDCGHFRDLVPCLPPGNDAFYRDVKYVRNEVQMLARQLNDATVSPREDY